MRSKDQAYSYQPLLEGSEISQEQRSPREAESAAAEFLTSGASEQQVFQLLGQLARARPGIFQRVLAVEKSCAEMARTMPSFQPLESQPQLQNSESTVGDVKAKAEVKPFAKSAPIVQFSAYVYVADEEEGVAKLDVVRLGDQSKPSQVRWSTKDASGKAWETYEPASGTLSFEAGEGQRALVIKLIPTDRWSPVLDFAVELLEEGLENAKLGQYGVKTRIKVIDKDAFPCPEMQVITQMGGDSQESPQQVLHDFSLTRLVIEFCRLNFNCNAKVRVGTIKTIMLDAFRNLIKLLHLYLRVYWLDKILKTSEPEDELFLIQDRAQSLYVYMVALIVPFAILHIFEYLSLSWGVNGATTTWVQSALLRRYLNYSTAAQSVTQPAHIQVAMNFDAKTLAIDGYGNVLRLFNELENLAVLIVFQITAPYVFGKPFRPSAFTVVLVLPVVLFAFLYCRSGTTKKALAAESTSEANAVSEVEQTVTNFHLISDYSKRGAAVDQFERVVQIFRAASKEVGQMLFNNRYFCKWMSELLIAGWAGFGGFKVIAGELSLGLFLCDIQIFQTVEEISNRIFDIFVKLQTIGPSMERVVELLNLPTDLHERKQLQDNLRETTGYMRERVQKRRTEDVRMDLLPITLNNLSVTYTQASRSVLPPGQNAGWTTQKKIGCHGKLVIEQGTLVMLVGQLNCGKATRLRALGGAVLPNHVESLFIPSHLRVLHVDSQPVFFADTLFNNLTFGVTEGNPDGSQERVLKICEMLEVPKAVMDMITSGHVLEWDSACSNSEKQKLSLARAVISNPDVLVIHRPFISFDKRSVKKVAKMLKEFVQQRGVVQDAAEFWSRRPRTCIVSTIIPHGLEVADKIYRVTKDGADEVALEHATETLIQEHIFIRSEEVSKL